MQFKSLSYTISNNINAYNFSKLCVDALPTNEGLTVVFAVAGFNSVEVVPFFIFPILKV